LNAEISSGEACMCPGLFLNANQFSGSQLRVLFGKTLFHMYLISGKTYFPFLTTLPTAGIAPAKSSPVQTASSAVLSFFINLLYASRKPSVIKYDCAPVGNTAPIVDLATNGFPKDIPVKATFP